MKEILLSKNNIFLTRTRQTLEIFSLTFHSSLSEGSMMNDDRTIFVGNLVVNCSLSNSNALRPLSLSCHAHRILAHSHQYLSHAAHVRCQCEKRFKTSPHLSAMPNAHLLLTM